MVVQLTDVMYVALTHIRVNKEHPLPGLRRQRRQCGTDQRFAAILCGANKDDNRICDVHHGEVQTGTQPAHRFDKNICWPFDGQEGHIRRFVSPARIQETHFAQMRFFPEPYRAGQRRQDRHPLHFQLLRRGYPPFKGSENHYKAAGEYQSQQYANHDNECFSWFYGFRLRNRSVNDPHVSDRAGARDIELLLTR